MTTQMNLLVSLNAGYLRQLTVMLFSLLKANPDREVALYVMHRALTEAQLAALRSINPEQLRVESVVIPPDFLADAPVTDRYPTEMYYRIFAAKLLPKALDKILYLDPDLVVLNTLAPLYDLEPGENLFAAASHISENSVMNKVNELRLSTPEGAGYYNSGVMLMNLDGLRRDQREQAVFDYLRQHRHTLLLPDQDVLNAVFHDSILPVDMLRYNLSERCFGLYNLRPENLANRLTLDWVRQNTAIIHYCGRNKPWKKNYFGEFNRFYLELEQQAVREGVLS